MGLPAKGKTLERQLRGIDIATEDHADRMIGMPTRSLESKELRGQLGESQPSSTVPYSSMGSRSSIPTSSSPLLISGLGRNNKSFLGSTFNPHRGTASRLIDCYR